MAQNLLWAASFSGHIVLLAILLVRRRTTSFPIFTTFIGFQVVRTTSLFLILRFRSDNLYERAYWGLAILDYVLQVAVLFEIAKNVLSPTRIWVPGARVLLIAYSALSVGIAGALTLLVPFAGSDGWSLVQLRANLFTTFLDLQLILSMMLIANRLRLPWRSYAMGLAQGWSVWVIVAGVGDLASLWNFEQVTDVLSGKGRMVCYLVVLCFWAVLFFFPERKRPPIPIEFQRFLSALQPRSGYTVDD